jgi:toxin ParE1/3/4
MNTIDFSPDADADIVAMTEYFAQFSTDYGLELKRKITSRLEVLAAFPYLGTPRPRLHPNLRQTCVESYLIFYFPKADGIVVVRIIHGRRKITRKMLRLVGS